MQGSKSGYRLRPSGAAIMLKSWEYEGRVAAWPHITPDDPDLMALPKTDAILHLSRA